VTLIRINLITLWLFWSERAKRAGLDAIGSIEVKSSIVLNRFASTGRLYSGRFLVLTAAPRTKELLRLKLWL